MKDEKEHQIIDIIKSNNFSTYYILDSDKRNVGKNEMPYEKYCTKYKQLVPNSLFLYRQPKRLAKNRKFSIYGGGIIYKIVEEDGIFTAYIKDGFEIDTPIMEDDEHLVNMKWTYKKKTNGWDHFWSQYGINHVSEDDIINIMENSVLIYIKDKENMTSHSIYDSPPNVESKLTSEKFVEKIRGDNDILQNNRRFRSRDVISTLISDLENDKLQFLGINDKYKAMPILGTERIAKGYDVLSYDDKGQEMHIGIKVSPFGLGRLDRVNRKDLEMFNDPNYYLYFVYNIDRNNGEFDFNVEKGTELFYKNAFKDFYSSDLIIFHKR